jgi:hypothetical protein
MCMSRQAMVVTGGGFGAGNFQSWVKAPSPSADERTLQQPGTGSQKDWSSVSAARRFSVRCACGRNSRSAAAANGHPPLKEG